MGLILYKKYFFKNTLQKTWHYQKNKFIFALLNNKMQRILLHIESANWFSPKEDYTMAGQVLLHE